MADWVPVSERESFGLCLKLVCKDKGITQRGLAELTGMSTTGINGYATDLHSPRFEAIESICDALNVSADVLLGRVPYESERYCIANGKIRERDDYDPEDGAGIAHVRRMEFHTKHH